MANKIISLGPDSTWGSYGKDLLSNLDHSIYRIEGSYSAVNEDNSKFSYKSYAGLDENEKATYEDLASTAEINKVMKVKVTDDETGEVSYLESLVPYNGEFSVAVRVKITPNAKLVTKFPNAHVFIDGKEWDLGILGTTDSPKTIDFVTDKVHRVKITWAKNIAETFRIKPNTL